MWRRLVRAPFGEKLKDFSFTICKQVVGICHPAVLQLPDDVIVQLAGEILALLLLRAHQPLRQFPHLKLGLLRTALQNSQPKHHDAGNDEAEQDRLPCQSAQIRSERVLPVCDLGSLRGNGWLVICSISRAMASAASRLGTTSRLRKVALLSTFSPGAQSNSGSKVPQVVPDEDTRQIDVRSQAVQALLDSTMVGVQRIELGIGILGLAR